MAASDLLAEVFARFSTCFRIFLADTASYLALRKSSSNPPKKRVHHPSDHLTVVAPVELRWIHQLQGKVVEIYPLFPGFGMIVKDFWTHQYVGFSETFPKHLGPNTLPIWTHFFALFFYRGGCEVGLYNGGLGLRSLKCSIFLIITHHPPGDSKKWPFDPQTLEVTIRLLKGHVLTIPKRSQRIARLKWFKQASYERVRVTNGLWGTKPFCSLQSQNQASQGAKWCFSFWMIRFFTQKNGESLKPTHTK